MEHSDSPDITKDKVAFFPFFVFLSLINLFLNFLGLPYVKQVYLAQVVVLFFLLFFSQRERGFWALVIFSLFEGQGRVIMGYNIFFRLIFDIVLGVFVLRAIISNKKLINREIVPNYLSIGIILHFIWFIVELFNPNGAGLLPSLITSKIFIFPFLLFFFFLNFPIDINRERGQKYLLLISIFLFLSSALVLFQLQKDQIFLYGISTNYRDLFAKYQNFTDNTFRPWGTSFTPGGMGSLFYMMCPFLVLFEPKKVFTKKSLYTSLVGLLKWVTIFTVLIASFSGQVRSATLKLGLILGLSFFNKFLASRLKAKKLVSFALVILTSIVLFPIFSGRIDIDTSNFDSAIERYEGLADSGFLANRASFGQFMDIFEERVELPFGFGLGMTSNYLPDFEAKRKTLVNIPKTWFWTFDNLFLFLFLELGLGALFYLFILFSVNLSLISRWLTVYRWRALSFFSIVNVCTVTVFVVTIFNWGAKGIPFNPESFYYWFWSGLAFVTFKKSRDERKEKEKLSDKAAPI